MEHITGIARNQMVFSSLEDTILLDNPFVLSVLLQTVSTPLLYLARLEKNREQKEKWDSIGC